MKKIILIIALLAFPLVCFGQDAISKVTPKYEKGVSKEKIIEAAKSKAAKLGFNLEEMAVSYDEGNQQFKEHLKSRVISVNNTENKLWITTPKGKIFMVSR